MIAATARQLAAWALLSSENTHVLREAFKDGVDALLELCLEKCGITMAEIRRLHALRFTTLNPITDLIDRAAGKQWYSTPNFWDGGVSDAATVSCEPERTLYQIIIYGELFSSTMTSVLQPELGLPKLDLQTRLDYIRYCVPDIVCATGRLGSPGLGEAEARGPYRDDPEVAKELDGDQVALHHLLQTRKWSELFQQCQASIGPNFDGPAAEAWQNEESVRWRQKMWLSVFQCQGWESIEMMRPRGMEKFKDKFLDIRAQIDVLDQEPKTYKFGRWENPGTEFPYMFGEVFVCVAGYWQP